MTSVQRAREIFEAVVDLPVEARAAAIDLACGGDGALAGEIRELLRVLEGRGEFLSSPTAATESLSTPSERPGDQIGPYKLLQQIGEGGFGVVFMAEQTEPIRRRVALKVIKLGMDTKQVIARFEAERQALAMMDHPNIARVFDAGATDEGQPYFAMELVAGMPITEYCDREKLSVRERVALMVPVCEAVQHAHHKGIIHRDLKPSNVLVTVQDGKPVPKIIDFGIAKAISQRLTERTLFTEFGQFIGTPEYMSPEQADMPGLDVDARSDVYSLGVLLYELLAGGPPFDGATLRSKGFDEMRRIIREDEPPRLSARAATLASTSAEVATRRRAAPGELGSLLKKEHEWIVLRCMEKDRKRRYVTPAALADDLERLLANEAVAAAPPSTGYQIRKFVRRHRREVVVASIGSALVLLGLAGTSVGMAWALRERNAARVSEATSRENEALVLRLVSTWPIISTPANEAKFQDELRSLAERLGRLRGENDTDVTRLRALQAQWEWSHLWLAEADKTRSDALLDRAPALLALAERARRVLPPSDLIMASLENSATQATHVTSTDPSAIAEAYERLIRAARESRGPRDAFTLNMMLERAILLLQHDRGADADRQLGEFRSQSEPLTPELAQSIFGYASMLAEQLLASSDEADFGSRFMTETLPQIIELACLPGSDDWYTGMRYVGRWHWSRQSYDESQRVYATICAQLDRAPPRKDAILPMLARFRLGASLVAMGRHAEAEPLLRDAVRRAEAFNGDDHFYTHQYRAWLAESLAGLGRIDEVVALLEHAIEGINRQQAQAGVDPAEAQRELARTEHRLDALRAAGRPLSPPQPKNDGGPP